jgi:sulfatase maturation enzyme AslB (radical SAM superfamily)
MERTHQINGIEELISYFKEPHLSFAQIEQITNQGLNLIFVEEHTKEQAIELLIKFWNKWKDHNEKPLFIMLEEG